MKTNCSVRPVEQPQVALDVRGMERDPIHHHVKAAALELPRPGRLLRVDISADDVRARRGAGYFFEAARLTSVRSCPR